MNSQYKVIIAGAMGPGPEQAATRLAELVEAQMRNGWTPVGGVTLGPPETPVNGKPFVYLLQAVIKS
jgi:hypothetical protein